MNQSPEDYLAVYLTAGYNDIYHTVFLAVVLREVQSMARLNLRDAEEQQLRVSLFMELTATPGLVSKLRHSGSV